MLYLTISVSSTSGVYRKIEDSDMTIISDLIGAVNIDMLGTKVVSVKGHVKDVKIRTLESLISGLQIHDSPPSLQDIPIGESAGAAIADEILHELDDRTVVKYDIDDRLIYLLIESTDTSPEMQSFFVDFLSRSNQSDDTGEIVVLGRKITSHYVCGFYGVLSPSSDPDPRKTAARLTARLLKRKNRTLQKHEHDMINRKYLANHNIIRTTVLKDFNTFLSKAGECVLTSAQGICLDKIKQYLRLNPHYAEPVRPLTIVRSVSTRKTAEEIDTETREKVIDAIERINRHIPIQEQVKTNFKLDEDTIASLVSKRVFMISERVFLRSNRRIIQQELDLNMKNFKASETESARTDRVRAARDNRLALAASFVQTIQRYCDERVDENGFCNLKSAYTHKVLKAMAYEEIITEDDMLQGLSVKDDIDAILSTRVEENNSKNKGEVQKAIKIARKLVEIFHTRISDFDFDNFNMDARRFIELNVLDSDNAFSMEDFRVFCRLRETVMWYIQEYHSKIVAATHQFIETCQAERSAAARTTSEEEFRELLRQKEILSNVLTERAKLREARREHYGKSHGKIFEEKLKVYEQNPDDVILSSEDRRIISDFLKISQDINELFIVHDVESIDDLQDKERLLNRVSEFHFDVTPFTPSTDEIREYIRQNIETIVA